MGETWWGKTYADPCAVVPLLIPGRAVETCPFPMDEATPEVGSQMLCHSDGQPGQRQRRTPLGVRVPSEAQPPREGLWGKPGDEIPFPLLASCNFPSLGFFSFFLFFFGQLIGELIFFQPKGTFHHLLRLGDTWS